MILDERCYRITYPMLPPTLCVSVSIAEKRYDHSSAGRVGVT